MSLTDRQTQILRAAAEWLDDGRDPFSTPFLVEHDVTLDECFTLGELLALGASLVLSLLGAASVSEG